MDIVKLVNKKMLNKEVMYKKKKKICPVWG